ncbi:hypothetical protein CLW00_1032 [Mongoliibacter ruber]|uniref:Uncharacterized protein n=1 Tax=Mongoliibacter ruber TaxID=1750599 RepID=A0A2T0WQA7_9BACT|nr:hypothetical protein CLW00_1032 [Mongoliibacter ruber]
MSSCLSIVPDIPRPDIFICYSYSVLQPFKELIPDHRSIPSIYIRTRPTLSVSFLLLYPLFRNRFAKVRIFYCFTSEKVENLKYFLLSFAPFPLWDCKSGKHILKVKTSGKIYSEYYDNYLKCKDKKSRQ